MLTIGINRAVDLLAGAAKKASAPAKALGDHPKSGKPITLGSGRFGPYVKHASVYASIPKGTEPDSVTLEQALELIEAKIAKDAAKKGKAPKEAETATVEGAEAPVKEKKAPVKKAAAKAPAKKAPTTTTKATTAKATKAKAPAEAKAETAEKVPATRKKAS